MGAVRGWFEWASSQLTHRHHRRVKVIREHEMHLIVELDIASICDVGCQVPTVFCVGMVMISVGHMIRDSSPRTSPARTTRFNALTVERLAPRRSHFTANSVISGYLAAVAGKWLRRSTIRAVPQSDSSWASISRSVAGVTPADDPSPTGSGRWRHTCIAPGRALAGGLQQDGDESGARSGRDNDRTLSTDRIQTTTASVTQSSSVPCPDWI